MEGSPVRVRHWALCNSLAVLLALLLILLAGCSELDPETSITVETEHERGAEVAAASGCLGCHRIGEQGNTGPGPDLSESGTE